MVPYCFYCQLQGKLSYGREKCSRKYSAFSLPVFIRFLTIKYFFFVQLTIKTKGHGWIITMLILEKRQIKALKIISIYEPCMRLELLDKSRAFKMYTTYSICTNTFNGEKMQKYLGLQFCSFENTRVIAAYGGLPSWTGTLWGPFPRGLFLFWGQMSIAYKTFLLWRWYWA